MITHIDEGLDFLSWRIQRHHKRGTDRSYVYTYLHLPGTQSPAGRDGRGQDVVPADEHEPATAGPAAASHSAAAGLVLAGELGDPQTGTRVVLEHIVNILLVQIVRAWLADQHSAHAGPSWLRGLGDAATLRVLLALHEHPARAWTARELADTAGVSVSRLTRRFTSLVGMTPAEYLRRWRLDLAAHRLRTSDRPVAAVARSVGYTSEFAFTRAFTRHQGQPPARYRSRSRRLASRAAQAG